MKENYKSKIKGVITIDNLTTGEKNVFYNIPTNAFYNHIALFFTGNPSNGIRYFGIGNGEPIISPTTTDLTNEVFRKIISGLSVNNDEMIYVINIDGGEAVGSWTEMALFEDSTGGAMFTIAEADYTHVEGEVLNITYSISRE